MGPCFLLSRQYPDGSALRISRVPGIVIATTALLRRNPAPGDSEIREALNDHLCRCGAHPRVLQAIGRLVREGRRDGA